MKLKDSKIPSIIVAFVPVLHEGYRKFFVSNSDASVLYILGEDVYSQFKPLTKDIRVLDPRLIKKAIDSWGVFKKVEVLTSKKLTTFGAGTRIVMPDEDVSRELIKKYFKNHQVLYDSIFLRWDKHRSQEEKSVEVDQAVSIKDFDRSIIRTVKLEGERSSDWWRRVGAAVVRDKKIILLSHNEHVPSPHLLHTYSDPRNNFHKGDRIELSTVLHAEAKLISEAAKDGLPLRGCSIYVSTFPCPPCAKLIAYSGIKKLYYSGGYGVLDGESVLKSQGVKIVFVDMSTQL